LTKPTINLECEQSQNGFNIKLVADTFAKDVLVYIDEFNGFLQIITLTYFPAGKRKLNSGQKRIVCFINSGIT